MAKRKRLLPVGRPTRAQLDAALKRFSGLFAAWGAQGGRMGAKARWENVTPEQRRAQAKKAAAARWKKSKKK